jgi:hypothetical protein
LQHRLAESLIQQGSLLLKNRMFASKPFPRSTILIKKCDEPHIFKALFDIQRERHLFDFSYREECQRDSPEKRKQKEHYRRTLCAHLPMSASMAATIANVMPTKANQALS